MKQYILYTLLVFTLFACKTDKKQTSNNLVESIKSDSISSKTQKQKPQTLKEKLIGERCIDAIDFARNEGYYIPGGFLVGSTFNNEHIVAGKTFGITRVRGKEKEEKNYTTHLMLKESYEDKNYPCRIVDLLELEKETDIFKKFPNKDIDIYSDVLLNNERAPELLALAEYEESDIMTNVYKVWRANRKTGKFEEVKDISGITVVNEDY